MCFGSGKGEGLTRISRNRRANSTSTLICAVGWSSVFGRYDVTRSLISLYTLLYPLLNSQSHNHNLNHYHKFSISKFDYINSLLNPQYHNHTLYHNQNHNHKISLSITITITISHFLSLSQSQSQSQNIFTFLDLNSTVSTVGC